MRLPRRHDGTCSAVAYSAAVDAGDLSEFELIIEDELADPCAHGTDSVELCRCFPNWLGWSMVPELNDRVDHGHGHYGDHLRRCRLCIRKASLPGANHCLRTDFGRNDGSQRSDVRSPLHDVFRGRAGEFLYCADFPPGCLPLGRVHHDAILLAGAQRNGGSRTG